LYLEIEASPDIDQAGFHLNRSLLRRGTQGHCIMVRANRFIMNVLICGFLLGGLADTVNAQQPPARPVPQRATQATPTPAMTTSTQAQQTPVAQPTVSTAPQRTTATYDDWIVQCDTQAGSPPRKVCEMAQLTQLQVQGKTQPFSRVAVPHPIKGMPTTLTVQVPVNVSFVGKVKIQTGESDSGLEVSFSRCQLDGCFAEFSITDDGLSKFRAANAAGKLSFADSTGRPVTVPLSFNGFGKAFDGLAKE
jgi:invasion protein IalB